MLLKILEGFVRVMLGRTSIPSNFVLRRCFFYLIYDNVVQKVLCEDLLEVGFLAWFAEERGLFDVNMVAFYVVFVLISGRTPKYV